MKILLWHGYLLGGTGSNVYTRSLARAWSRLGHDVVVLCQEPHPDAYDLGGATVVRPRLAGPLPVFVLDRYEDLEARYVQDLAPAERDDFVERNAAALREHLPADYVLVNHVLLGAPVGAAAGAPFAVKAHGSELEFSIRGRPELASWARACLDEAAEVVVGSEHIRDALADVVGWSERVRVVPPGVDVEALRPEPRDEALERLPAEAAACGSPPLVARHSGLAEVAAGLEAEYRPEHRRLASFAPGDARDLAAKLAELLALPPEEWSLLAAAVRRTAVERWSWEHVASLLLSAPWVTSSG